jgi:hypothetical protein
VLERVRGFASLPPPPCPTLTHPLTPPLPPCSGNPFVEDPYTGARFQPSCEGALSPVGNLARIGAPASGLSPVLRGG